ncbi:MAG: alpha/beta hydrolase [Alphaproteobacteria bacterium]|nr:alpha/beta hydrolase [Alphaproteobacteria bacterium]
MISAVLIILAATILALLVFTRFQSRRIERLFPVIGEMVDVGGYRLHCVHLRASSEADLPPVVFIHGASGNLRDQMMAFRDRLEGRADLLFVDRPGHGWSERGNETNRYPDGQARAIAALLEHKKIDHAVICGHSFGGAIAASMALEAPHKVSGLLLLSAATHPWPGGVDWHYTLSATPVLGRLFTELLTMPAGLMRISRVSRCVFRPNAYPDDYLQRSATALVLRPQVFRNNGSDVASLHDHVTRTAPHYRTIQAPTVIITGDIDEIVSPDIHSVALARDIAGSQLLRIRGIGHKPDFAATDLCVAAIEHLSGSPQDLARLASDLERRLAS